jgi:hypothetical protein
MSEQERLSGAQIAELRAQYEKQLSTLIERMQLRKWCVEQARIGQTGPNPVQGSIVANAQAMFDFITADAKPEKAAE